MGNVLHKIENVAKNGFKLAAIAGVVAGVAGCEAMMHRDKHASSSGKMVKCMGVNSCKGTSQCATAHHKCNGHNACKGQGWVSTTYKECMDQGGHLLER